VSKYAVADENAQYVRRKNLDYALQAVEVDERKRTFYGLAFLLINSLDLSTPARVLMIS
jgi:hypothetical protein